MGFAVRRPGNPDASPRSHRMPCGDVLGRVDVCVAGVTAGGASEDRLALAVLRRHMSARAAALAGERGIDLFDPAGSFLLQPFDQDAPAGGEDFPVEPGLGTHVAAGSGHGAPSRARHVPYPQILHTDHIEPADQVSRELSAQSLLASAPRTFSRAIACLTAARRLLPRLARASLRWSRLSRRWQDGDRRGQVNISPVDRAALTTTPRSTPTTFPVPGAWMGRGMAANAMCQRPARSSFTRNDLAWGTVRLQRNRTQPTLEMKTCPQCRFSRRTWPALKGYDPETLVVAGLAPGGLAMRAVEEVRHSLGVVPQGLLLDHYAARRQPCMLAAGLGQLVTLLNPAGRALAARAPPGLLLDS